MWENIGYKAMIRKKMNKFSSSKIKVGILGTGNIGSDLLFKIQRSKILECGIFAGKNPDSENIKRVKAMGIPTSYNSIQAIVENPECCDIVFDATSARSHIEHAKILKKLKKFTIDLTPSKIGKMCVPFLNMDECLKENNVNMISCGAQATIPIIFAIKKVHQEMPYVEIVSSMASKSAGIGTRDNIDEYTQATSDSIRELTGTPQAKAIIILNPAEPPIFMHNTIYAKIENPKMDPLLREINKTVEDIRKYIPGYKLTLKPVYENNRLTTMSQVIGVGDFLPKFAGNLDIMTCAAITVAESYAIKMLNK